MQDSAASAPVVSDPVALAAAIRAEAHALGFDLVRFATAEPFAETAALLHDRISAGYYEGLPWFSHDRADVAGDPANLLPGVKTIVSLGISYLTDGEPDATERGEPHGRIARYAWGQDYHDVFQERLRRLHAFVEIQLGRPVGARHLADTARITDRAVAQRAGLGWYGKNSNLLTREFGSWVLLGELLLDVALPPDQPLRTHCGACTRCMPACPTGAIVAPGVINNDRCISYLTIELRGPIPRELRPLVGNWIFGCDLCQEVCPVNSRREPPNRPEFQPRQGVGSSPALLPLLDLTEEDFRVRFKGSPIRRAKWAGLRRNVCVALGNLGDPVAVPALMRVLQEEPAMVRGHAAWALGRIGGPGVLGALRARLRLEPDPWVREEVVLALGTLQTSKASTLPGHGEEHNTRENEHSASDLALAEWFV